MRLVWRAGAVFLAAIVATLVMAAQASVGAPTPVPAPAATPAPLSMLALRQLEAGLWQLDTKGRAPKQVCVSDGSELIQVEHDQTGCSRFMIANDAKASTVHYSCQGAGWGRTTIRVETARQVQVQTQGISHNAPFDFVAEGHRIGACGATVAASRPR